MRIKCCSRTLGFIDRFGNLYFPDELWDRPFCIQYFIFFGLSSGNDWPYPHLPGSASLTISKARSYTSSALGLEK